MNIVTKPLSELHSPAKNIRRHTERQLNEYVRSLQMFGQIKPIVADEHGEIIAGNGLYEALKLMGAESCQCYIMSGLSEVEKKKLMLADNRVYELGITDTNIFDEIIRELEGDIDVPGWDADLLEMLNSSVAEANNMVESYGTYGASEVNAVNSKERADHSAPPEARSAEPATEAAAPVKDERFIVCPKCGERICL